MRYHCNHGHFWTINRKPLYLGNALACFRDEKAFTQQSINPLKRAGITFFKKLLEAPDGGVGGKHTQDLCGLQFVYGFSSIRTRMRPGRQRQGYKDVSAAEASFRMRNRLAQCAPHRAVMHT